MITLRWAPYPEANVVSYKIYRSIIGFVANIPLGPAISGKTLELKMNGGATQTFTFNSSDSVVDTINNTISGGEAFLSYEDEDKFLLRSNLRDENGSVEIVGGTGLSELGLTARVITEKSEDGLLSTVPAAEDPSSFMSFSDEDGALQDWYAISTVDSIGKESLKTEYKQAISFVGPLCVMEGIITDLQGVRQVDEEVRAKIVLIPQGVPVYTSISKNWVSTLSGPDGRFSLPLLQGAVVKFEVPVLGYSRNIRVPEKAYEFIKDLYIDLDYRYPLS